MKITADKNRKAKSQKHVRQVINRLLTTIDRTLEAVEDVKQARKDLDRLALSSQKEKERPSDATA